MICNNLLKRCIAQSLRILLVLRRQTMDNFSIIQKNSFFTNDRTTQIISIYNKSIDPRLAFIRNSNLNIDV
ncbi:hypothetical protein WI82_05270 [Burkholderia ubonensis]|nr:hypothetical protein WI82_05270 [Burkholderia ubonensis]